MAWLITVDFPTRNGERTALVFKLNQYPTIREGRLLFIDNNGNTKNFPYQQCSIEEVKQ